MPKSHELAQLPCLLLLFYTVYSLHFGPSRALCSKILFKWNVSLLSLVILYFGSNGIRGHPKPIVCSFIELIIDTESRKILSPISFVIPQTVLHLKLLTSVAIIDCKNAIYQFMNYRSSSECQFFVFFHF